MGRFWKGEAELYDTANKLATSLAGLASKEGVAYGEDAMRAPSSPPVVTGSAPTNRGPVPSVSRRLDLSGYLADPCKLLTKGDLAALGFTGGYVVVPSNPDAKERRCEVGGGSGGGLLHLTLRADASPLPEAYASTSDRYEFFQARDVDGFPAVELGESVKWPMTCVVSVGTDESGDV
jgi:hypothetical protein